MHQILARKLRPSLRSGNPARRSVSRGAQRNPTGYQVLAVVGLAAAGIGLIYGLDRLRPKILRRGRQGDVQWAINGNAHGCPQKISWEIYTEDVGFQVPQPAMYPQQPQHYTRTKHTTIASGCAADVILAQAAVDAALATLVPVQ